ncbi:MAG: alpha/beta hydrolase, partial [Cyanobacteria bacterium J06633_2]
LFIGILSLIPIASPAGAAEQIVFKYRSLRRTVPISDLSTFAETGEPSDQLERYLDAIDDDPERFRQTLNQQIRVDPVMLDRGLNHPLGHVALDQLTPIIHTSSRERDREALRAALVLSASDDDHISMMELIETYPTQELHVEGDRLIEAYNDIEQLRDRLERWTAWLNLDF